MTLALPSFVLGCGNFGGIGSSPAFFGQGESEDEAQAVMSAAWDAGLHWFDTADAYGGGRSETAIGRWIRDTGNRPQLTTKTFNPMAEGADHGLSRDRIHRQIGTSLERLGVDRVDLYLAHEFDPDVPVQETVGAFEELVSAGTVGAWGVSNVDGAQLRAVLAVGHPAAVQNSYSLLDRRDEEEVIPLCREHAVAYQAFSPLAGGWLTGKYRRGEPVPEGSRMTMRPEPYRHLDDDLVYDGLDSLAAAARGRGVSQAGVALAGVVAGGLSAVIGPRNAGHLRPAQEAEALSLSEDERAELESLFP